MEFSPKTLVPEFDAFLAGMGLEFEDLINLRPTRQELLEAMQWVKQQDGNPGWPDWVESRLAKLAEALGYAL